MTGDIDIDLADDLLSNFFEHPEKLSDPVSAEEWLMDRLTEGSNPAIHVIRYNLIQNIQFRLYAKSKGIHFTRRDKDLTGSEYAALVNEDYLTRARPVSLKYAEAEGRGKLDLPKFLDMLYTHPIMADCEEIARKNYKEG